MESKADRRPLARGEAQAEIQWGAEVEKVLEILRANYGIEGPEADAIVADALKARRDAIRKKATIGLVFALIGLAVAATYFAIQGFVGLIVIGGGPVLMAVLGIVSATFGARSLYRVLTGKASGPA